MTRTTAWWIFTGLALLWLWGNTATIARAQQPTGVSNTARQTIDARGTPPADATARPAPEHSVEGQVEAFVKAMTLYLARFVEAASAVIIGIASIRAFWGYLVDVARGQATAVPKEEIRLSLGRTLALALEFQLGADILKTAVAPTWQDVELLAAIALIRTALNYFLGRELREAEKRNPGAGQTPLTAPHQ